MKTELLKNAVILVALIAFGSAVWGGDGSWSTNASGNWSAGTNWSGGTVADGFGYTAFFTNNISGTRTVDNNAIRTIGHLEFSDAGGNSQSWVLSGGSVLTLSTGGDPSQIRWLTPTEIITPLAGSVDMLFSGSSVGFGVASPYIKLKGTNTYTGTTILRKGVLYASGNVTASVNGPLGNSTSVIQIGDAGTQSSDHLALYSEANNANFARPVVVNNYGNTVAVGGGNLTTANDPMIWSGGITLNRNVILASRANLRVPGKITGPGGFIRSSSDNNGTIILEADNDFSGDISISRGILVAAHSNALGTATTRIQLGDADTAANNVALLLTNGITFTRELLISSNGTGTVSIGPQVNSANCFYTGKITLQRTLTIAPKSTGGSSTISGPISGTGGLIFLGNSDGYSYITCPTNSFTGDVTISAGIVVVNNEVRKNQDGPLGNSASTIIIQAAGTSVAKLYVDSNGLVDRDVLVTNTTLSALIGTRTATNLLFTSDLTVNTPQFSIEPLNATNRIEWTGQIQGTGIVKKAGTGVLVVTGTNSNLTGGFQLGGGTLRVNSPDPIGTGPFQINSTGTRLENDFGHYIFSNRLEIVRDPRYYGSYDLVFTGDKSIMGNLADTPVTVDQTNSLLGFRGNLTSYDKGTLTKLGAGVLDWGGTNLMANFTNNIILNAGVFRAFEGVGISTQNTIRFTGGVWESAGLCTRVLGTNVGSGQIHWGAGAAGGFSAYGAPFTVNLGGSTATVYFNSNNFVNGAGSLVFGSVRSDKAVIFKNPIDINGATRSIIVYDNTNAITDKAVLEGGVALGSYGFNKGGNGVLVLGGTNTGSAAINVNLGTLLMDGELVASASPMVCKTNTWLGGRGTIKRRITLDAGFGGFDWADTPGTLTVQTNMTLPSGFTYNFRRIGGQAPLVNVTGTLTVSNGVTVNVFSETEPQVTLFTAGTLAGTNNVSDWVVVGSRPYVIEIEGLSIIARYKPAGSFIIFR
jgi:autotransporter-associated beta strand protein